LPKRVPVFANPQEGSSMRNESRALRIFSDCWLVIDPIIWREKIGEGTDSLTVAVR
jgi:hypothetical protein